MVFKLWCALYFPGEPVKMLIPGLCLSEILIMCTWNDALKSAFEQASWGFCCGWSRGILWENVKAKFFPLRVDPGIPLLGIYYKEIFQNIAGSVLILTKSWQSSKYPPIRQRLNKLHSASVWWNITQMLKRMPANCLCQHGKYKWKRLRFKIVYTESLYCGKRNKPKSCV